MRPILRDPYTTINADGGTTFIYPDKDDINVLPIKDDVRSECYVGSGTQEIWAAADKPWRAACRPSQ